ncbi:proton-coupled folate transporter [Bactrocera dorsalis]|uniref:Proton-coupled folate transporter n=1 Tax=Bactrocera dorsalis TaxID=27457 RepID=A0ABM3JJU8_BACDO|nr:proton-coupled folate transporter [Bactrocera dorsalis]XP_049309502.1 proton-coupled folate transporter [Bactrocera dorsalis]
MTKQDDRTTPETPSSASADISFDQEAYDAENQYRTPAYMPTISADGLRAGEFASTDPLTPQTRRMPRRRIMSLELPVFLMFVGFLLAGSVMLNQELYQTCVAVYHYNETDCEPLRGIIPKTAEAQIIEKTIQPFVAKITMTSSILNNVWPGILILFVGPWSDKFGRRPVLLATFTAAFLGQVITTILVSFSQVLSLNPWFYLLASIPSTLVGGGCAMITIVFCYISDVTDIENKARRMFFINMSMGLGVVIGNIGSSYLLRLTNTTIVCATSAALVFIALMYVLFFIGESLDVEETTFAYKAKHFFDVRLIKDLVKTCATRRPNYGRAIIACTISILIVSNFALTGELGVFYLFLRNKFNTTLQEFTYYNAVDITIKMVGCGVAFGLFRNFLKISFSAIALMGLFGCILDSLTRGLAQQFWQMYMAASFGLMSGITGPMLQSIVSLAVSPNEIGKIYSLASCLQTLSPLLSAPLYTFVYNATLDFYPGLYNFISTGLHMECFCVMILIYIFERRVKNRDAERPTTDSTTTQKT